VRFMLSTQYSALSTFSGFSTQESAFRTFSLGWAFLL
jgi:hypothetical protein